MLATVTLAGFSDVIYRLELWENLMRITMNSLTLCAAAGLVLGTLTDASYAGTISGGALLNNAGADQLETWLGVSDQDIHQYLVWHNGCNCSQFPRSGGWRKADHFDL